MQDHLNIFNFERWVKSRIAYLPESSFSNHGDNHPSKVTVIQRRLDKHDIGNIVPVLSYVPMHIELRHIAGSKR